MIDTGIGYSGGVDHWGTGEVQSYTSKPENLRLTGDGTLQITPLKDSAGKWTSGRIETVRTNFMAAPGEKMRIQASIKMPDVSGDAAIGYWPAFWTLGAAYRGNYWNWPSIGEFDIMENVNGISSVWATFHCDKNPGGACNETDGISGKLACPGSACQGNFHTYTLEVDRSNRVEQLNWFVDGRQFHSVKQTAVPAAVWDQVVHQGHFILLNLAIGGQFPDKVYKKQTPIAATVPGRPMYVDYVAVYNT